MRMNSFIVGGILGAAAAIYLKRNNNSMMYSLGQAGETMNKMMNTARNKMMEMSQNGVNNFTSESNNDLDKVEKITNEDPQLKRQVDEILKDNGSSNFQTQ